MIGFGQSDIFNKIRVIKGKEKVEHIFEGVGKSSDKNQAISISRSDAMMKIINSVQDSSLDVNIYKGLIPMEQLYPNHSFFKKLKRKERRKYNKLIRNNLTIDTNGIYTHRRYYIVPPLDKY